MRNGPSHGVFIVSLIISFSLIQGLCGQVDFQAGASFRYLKGSDAMGLGEDWIDPGFDDAGWSTGSAPFRYGDGIGGTELTDMQYSYSTLYLRSTFVATHSDSLEALILSIDYDDGFVVWINGKRVLSQYAPMTLAYNAFATENHESGLADIFELDPDLVDLVEGENTLAIQGFNISLESTDFLFDISMKAEVIVPVLEDTVGLDFSVPSGFYDSAFYLDIVAADPAWDVVYTLDGSNPQDSETSFITQGSVRVRIDPLEGGSRPQTPAVVVRASAAIEGILPAVPESRTYIFLHRVLIQEHPGGDWPMENINEQVIDLEMDPRIVTHQDYQDEMIPALLDVPTISVVTDLKHLFDPQSGIYVNAHGHGHAWERECSVELINPDGAEGFHVNAGLRIRGGWSRHPEFPKHAFRLFFRSEYGDPKLYFPLFGEEGVEQYDKVDLRCSQNYAWSNGDGRNTYLRDLFSRDTQRDMGQPYTRSRYYHLYLNGMYWGLFQTQERSEARYAADYFGGKTADYDVIKVDTEDWNYQLEATDGDFTGWWTLWDMCGTGFASNRSYFRLEGKDEEGNPEAGGEVHVDIDNLIDYLLTIFYTGNFDSPTASFMGNKRPNNFFAIDSRVDRSRGFTFFVHDAEHSLFSEAIDPGKGLYEDRVNLSLRTDGMHMDVYNFGAFHPQWLHHKLTENEEYRMRFRDRAHLRLTGSGVLTPDQNEWRLNQRAAEIETAIIAESARWGDGRSWVSYPFTKNDNWIPQVNRIRAAYFPFRTQIVINQLVEANLFSEVDPPMIFVNGDYTEQQSAPLDGTAVLEIENPNHKGIICYTTDGSDPRMVGGRILEDARMSVDHRALLEFQGSAVILARIRIGETWSALKQFHLIAVHEDYTDLAITELHYHPTDMIFEGDSISGKDLEFIEFKNTGADAIDLSGLILDSAIYYEFPEDAVLAPGHFFVVASKPSTFYLRYGRVASGNYQKNLSNGGEEVLLRERNGQEVIRFTYADNSPWPIEADGVGYSLVSTVHNPSGSPDTPEYWNRSHGKGGSPFADDPASADEDPPGEDVTDILVYPNPTSGELHILLPENADQETVQFSLYGMKGNLVLQVDHLPGGTIHLEGLNLASGIYVVQIRTEEQIYTRKIMYQKE